LDVVDAANWAIPIIVLPQQPLELSALKQQHLLRNSPIHINPKSTCGFDRSWRGIFMASGTYSRNDMTLVKEAQAARVRAHICAMLSRLKAHIQKHEQQAA
jgi:hypothetical protein